MARNELKETRVQYWAAYRQTIAANFASPKKEAKAKVKAPKPEKTNTRTEKVTRAEALISEYERKNGHEEDELRKESNNLLVGLAILVFLLIVAGIIFMIWRYRP